MCAGYSFLYYQKGSGGLLRLAGIVRDSIVDGIGVRDVIFFQGCSHKCRGCHNPHTWNYSGGEHRFIGSVVKELSNSSNNITISGGEPLDQYDSLVELCKQFKKQGKSIWVYTGNTVPNKLSLPYRELSKWVEVIVDGKFIEEQKDSNLLFRGSSNQRLIDLPKSVIEQRIVLWGE